MSVVEEVENELRKIVREKYPNKSDMFYKVAEEIIEVFGFVYPGDTEALIDRIAQFLP